MRVRRFGLAALGLLLSCVACGGGSPESRALVLIVIDTLRGDRLGYSGYSAARTPHLDALAAEGTRFTDASTPVPVTLPAVASLFTGRRPFNHGVRDNEGFRLAAEEVTLAERFREAGWTTGAVLGSAVLDSDRGLDQGFDSYDDAFRGPYPVHDPALRVSDAGFGEDRRRATAVTDRALELVDEFGERPWFLLAHYFDVHTNYDPPPKYAALHPGRPYDGEISYVDAEIGRLLVAVRARRPDATVVVVSDHGEGLGEHGETLHGFLLYRSTLHVPFVAAGPGIPAGLTRSDPVSLVDVAPTLAAWFGLAPLDGADGRVMSWDRPPAEPGPIYAETMRTLLSYGWSELRSVREGDRKLIRGGGRDEVYDLAADPRERNDLGAGEAAVLGATLIELTGGETREQVLGRTRGEPARRELLESLGYTSGPGPGEGARPHPADALPAWTRAQQAKDMVRRAATFIQQGRPEPAEALMDTVLAWEPFNTSALYARARAREALLRTADAEADLRAALDEDPRHVPSLAMMAVMHEASGKVSLAAGLWETILREGELPEGVHPAAPLTQPSPARAAWETLMEETDPGGAADPTAVRRAVALLRLGRTEEASAVLRDYVAAAPAGDALRARLETYYR